MHYLRRTWPVAVLLAASLAVSGRAIAADVQTLRLATAPAAEAARYLAADALMAAASLVAFTGLVTGRSWVPWATSGWMATMLAVVGWVLFFALGVSGPPYWLRAGIWLACLGVSAYAVSAVRRVWQADSKADAA